MNIREDKKFLIVASHPESLLNFRGPLIRDLLDKGLQVHVAAPDLSKNNFINSKLLSLGLIVHKIHLSRTGMNPISDLKTIFQLWRLMKNINIMPKHTFNLKFHQFIQF